MGGGSFSSTYNVNTDKMEYDPTVRIKRYMSKGIDLHNVTMDEMFTNKTINNSMSPYGVVIRESRDSDEHPTSLAIIMGLDVTGSMMRIPHYLVTEGLPNIMGRIIQKGIEHPQILFMAIGDHEWDNAPLQVGQFESSDDLLDKWLTDVYLEGGGGGNAGESYLLAWYFAAFHTSVDCFEKGRENGFIVTIGDEPCLKTVPGEVLSKLMGGGQFKNKYTAEELLKAAQEKYNVYHINVAHNSKGRDPFTINQWKSLLGQNLIVVDDQEEIANAIADIIIKNSHKNNAPVLSQKNEAEEKTEAPDFVRTTIL